MSLETEIVTTPATGLSHESYVDWPAIIAGIVLASAISLVLLAFGAALGLGLSSFEGRSGVSGAFLAVAAALWLLWVQVSSFMVGGYLTGRMRRRFNGASEHEVDARDGAHGLLVWGGALVLGGIIAAGGLGAAVNAVGNTIGTVTMAASNAAGNNATFDPDTYFADSLFRSDRTGQTQGVRNEVLTILANAGTDEVSAEDRDYIAALVARETGLDESEAQSRVDGVFAQIDQAKQDAADLAESGRKMGILAAFLTAASLFVSAAGAYWAASMGGRHRDEGTVFATMFRRY